MVNYRFNIPYLPRWLGVLPLSCPPHLRLRGEGHGCESPRRRWGPCGGYTVGGTYVCWPFEWHLTQERSEVGRAARARSTQRTSTVISIFPVALIVFRWRMSRELDTIVRLSFPLLAGLTTNEAIFLGQTPIASEGALLCDFLPQLHGALYTGHSNEVPLFSVVIFQLERSKGHTDYSDKRCSLA